MMAATEVQPGSVWRHKAPEREGQMVRVLKLSQNYVMVRRIGARKKRWIGRSVFGSMFKFDPKDQRL